MRDEITLTGVVAFGYHGVLEEEKRNGQEFIVDVSIVSDFSRAVATDDVNETVNYAEVAQIAYDTVGNTRFDLIETLAHTIAERILELRGVNSVKVTINKPSAPIPVPFANVSVSRELP